MKKTVFEGTINGEKFDSVQEYNARMKDYLDAGVTVEASSNTRIEYVDDECALTNAIPALNEKDEDLSFYPYFEDDDPFYLDLLVTEDTAVNAEALKEIDNQFDKCRKYICENLEDPDISVSTKKEYLKDVRDIINGLKGDADRTEIALDSIDEELASLSRKIEKLKNDKTILLDAKPVIEKFIEFYENIETETLQAIQEHKCTNCGCGDCECTCDKVSTSCEETEPQLEISDIHKLFDRIFEGSSLFRSL